MSDATAPTDPNALLFPAFVYGEPGECRRKMKAEAKRWAKRYAQHGDFPEPKLIAVPAGSVMVCDNIEASAMALGEGARKPRWFFYLVEFLRLEASVHASRAGIGRAVFQPKFEAFACRYPWGALSVATNTWDCSLPQVIQQFEAVLSFWEQLDTLRYLRFRYFSLSELLLFAHDDTIRMWVDALGGKSARDLLREVIERMRNASEDEIQTRVWRRLYDVIETETTLKHREWLKSRDLLEAAMAHDRAHWPERYEDLKTGRSQAGFLSDLDAKYPNG